MACASVSTASTTVPIAGRLATFASLTPMSADHVRIECVFQADSRLLEAVPLVVRHAAQAAGIGESSAAQLGHETLEACRKLSARLAQFNEDLPIRLLVDHFQDRVEIVLEHAGEAIPQELGALVARNTRSADRVQRETSDDRSRIKFTKYCVAVDSKPAD